MAVNEVTSGYLLPCGRDVEQVWRLLDEPDPADPHDAMCPHCAQARAGLLALREVTGELAAEQDEPGPDLVGRIMSAVRADVRRRDLVALPGVAPGAVRVSTHAIAAILRYAVDGVEGVRARHCRVRGRETGAEVVIDAELSIAVGYHEFGERDLATVLDDVRVRVRAAAQARIGLRLERLDLRVDDVYDA